MGIKLAQLCLAPLYNSAFVDDAKPVLWVLALFTVIGYALPRRSPRVRNAAIWSAVGTALTSLLVRSIGLLTSTQLGGRVGAWAALAAVAGLMLLPWLVFSPFSFVPSLVGLALLLPAEFSLRVPAFFAKDAEGTVSSPSSSKLIPKLLIAAACMLLLGLASMALTLQEPKPFHMASLIIAVLTLAIAAQSLVNRPLAPFTKDGVTVHSSQQSVSGRVVVEDVQLPEHTMRVLRADHSLVGGRWLQDGKLGDS